MAEMAQDQGDIDYTDMPVGEILRRTRVHYEQSIEDIERALHIRATQIVAIENGYLDQLPGRVYAIGFVRSYSEYLGLDGDKMVGLFKRQVAGKAPQPELHFPVGASDSRLPAWWLIMLCAIAALVFLSFWFGGTQERREIAEEIPQVPEQMIRPQGPAVTIPPPVTGQAAPQPTEEEPTIKEKPVKGIILNIEENSWVEIRDKSGKAVLSRVLKAGDQYYVPDRPDLTISIGNAAGVAIEVDGQALRPLGETGKVLRRLPLDAAYLKKNFAVESAQ